MRVSRLASDLRDEARQAHEDDREKRMTSCLQMVQRSRQCKNNVMVQGDDGTHVANAEQVHALIERAWIPILKMHELGTQPTWSQFEAAFGEHIRAACECAVDELNGEKLKNACKKMKSASAPGADGWRVAELQALPLQLFEELAQVLNLVEETGSWPTPLACCLISLIQRGEGSAPQKLRPIRFATSCIGRKNGLALRCMVTGRRRAEDVWMDISRTVESDGSDLVGMSIDWSKCFD